MKKDDFHIGIVGLGYVGLPLAVALQKHFKLTGFDINKKKIDSLKKYVDPGNSQSALDPDLSIDQKAKQPAISATAAPA